VLPPGGTLVLLWERARRGLLQALPMEAPDRLALVVGPEGGIPEEDARGAERSGAELAGLGSNVLRTETAALVGAAVVLARYGRLG
jgi:16S rRNA (uracil1498-N3)-methyltransferase